MKKYINFLFKFRWLIIISVPLITLLMALNLQHLEIDGGYRIWFNEDSKRLIAYDKFKSEFSNNNGVAIIFKDENGIFNKKALQSIENITDALLKIKNIKVVDSLTGYQYIHSNKLTSDEIVVDNFIQDIKNSTPEYLSSRKKIALSDSMIVNGLISADGKTTMIFARFEADINAKISAKILKDVQAIIGLEAERTGYKYWLNGGPAIAQSFINIAGRDAMIFTPLAFFLSMILLFVLFRRMSGAMIPMLVVSFTIISVLSIQALLGYKLNNFTANIPVFIIAIGIADAVHLYSVWLTQRRGNINNFESVEKALEITFLPILLTSATTAVGFATLAISEVVPISTLGIAIASGTILAFIISVVWMPAVLLTFKNEVSNKSIISGGRRKSFGYGAFIVRNDKKIIIITFLLVGIVGIGLFRVKVDNNIIRYFDKETEIRKASEFVMENLTGPISYTIVVDSMKADGIKEPAFLKTLERFYEEFQTQFPNDMRHIFSLLEIIKRYNKVLNGKEEVPESRNLIAQYLLLYSISLSEGMETTDRMDFEQRKLCVIALINIVDSSKGLKMIHFIEEWWKNTPYTVEVTGQTVLYTFMQEDVTNTLIYSFLLTIIIVSLMMMLVFKSFKILLILLLPNILPIILVLGMMGWFGFTIDLGVAITGAIIIGIAMDDTIHFLVKYFDAKKNYTSIEEAFDEVLYYVGKAIIFTTLVLSVSFSIFAFSEFVPNQNLGIITAIALVAAMIIDLLFLPALLSVMNRRENIEFKNTKEGVAQSS